MRAFSIIHQINNELALISKKLFHGGNVNELLNRRTDLLHRKEIAEKYLYKF